MSNEQFFLVVGLLLFLIGTPLLIALLWWAVGPTGRLENVEGRVVGMGFDEREGQGSVRVASVSIDGIRVHVEAPARFGCRVGDRIALQRRATRWGALYGVGLTPHPCSPPAPFPQQ